MFLLNGTGYFYIISFHNKQYKKEGLKNYCCNHQQTMLQFFSFNVKLVAVLCFTHIITSSIEY